MTSQIKSRQKETLEYKRMNGEGWEPKNRDMKGTRAHTEEGRETSGNQPLSISLEAIALLPWCSISHSSSNQPTRCHLHTRTVLSIFKNIAFLLLKLLFYTLRRSHSSTAWDANFLATGDGEVSTGKAIHFLNAAARENVRSKYRNVQADARYQTSTSLETVKWIKAYTT
jgi:hypothetical protein